MCFAEYETDDNVNRSLM